MIAKTINMEPVSIVSSEWMFAFLIEDVHSHFSMADGNKFAMNDDGMWYFERRDDFKYQMYHILQE